MSERSGKRGEGEQKHGRDEDRSRFTGDGPGERGYRGSRADDVPPGDVPGGSYGGGGGRQQGGYSTSGPASRYGHADEFERGEWSGTEQGEWRTGYGAYGVGRDTSRRASWGRQSRDPGATFERRGGGWAAGEQPYQRGRGPRSYRTWTQEPWTRSEFAGRGEFGSPPTGYYGEAGTYSTGAAQEMWAPREHWNVPGPHSGRGPQGYRRSEAAIQEEVCERLTRHGGLDASRITVRVENNEVTLEGYVESRSAKRMAEDTAESVSGVQDVHNRLKIGSS